MARSIIPTPPRKRSVGLLVGLTVPVSLVAVRAMVISFASGRRRRSWAGTDSGGEEDRPDAAYLSNRRFRVFVDKVPIQGCAGDPAHEEHPGTAAEREPRQPSQCQDCTGIGTQG